MTDPAYHHRFSVHGRQGPITLDLTATLGAPWTVLFGPSGSGKSTLLRALAGLTPHLAVTFERRIPNAQTATADPPANAPADQTWQPLGTLPPPHRHLAYHPQGALLLPHLTVEQNIRFPETLRRTPDRDSFVPALLDLLHLHSLVGKRPAQLSGGERQRVSLARALAVPGARLLLLDEPFAGLDRTLRDQLLPPLRTHLAARALPVLSVTHDPDEALLLDAEVLRLHDGRLTGQGPAHAVLADETARLRNLLNYNS